MENESLNINEKDDFLNKKNILNYSLKENTNYYPYVIPKYGEKHIIAYKLSSLSIDYKKYIKYITTNTETRQFIYTFFSIYLELILTGYGFESTDKIYEVFTHENSGFTYNILHLIKQYSQIQPTFYFNFKQQYYNGYDLATKKEMIMNEFVRISNNFDIYKKIKEFFFSKIEEKNELFLLQNFSKLIEIIEESILLLKNFDIKNQYEKYNIVIDDFYDDDSNENTYFINRIRNRPMKVYYLIKIKYKFKFEGKNKISRDALDKFNEGLNDYQIIGYGFYKLQNEYFYVPKNYEGLKLDCYNIKLKKIVDEFGYNYVDLFRFQNEIEDFLDENINYDEFENSIISKYRKDYYSYFKNFQFLSEFFKEPLEQKNNSTNYDDCFKNVIAHLLFLPYIDIRLEEKKLYVLGPIYKKIINLIINEEKELDYIKNKKIYNNNIQYGISFEKYLKLLFQYQTSILYSKKITKIFILSQEIKNPTNLNWNYIQKKILINPNILFIIDQRNSNGEYFDILFAQTELKDNEIYITFFFIQISVKKPIQGLKKILDSFYCIVNDYKNEIKKYNYKFNNAFFYIISSENEKYKDLFQFCFDANLKINITYDENNKCFSYYSNPFVTAQESEIYEFPTEQNYYDLITNYIKFQGFEKIPKNIIFYDTQLLEASQFNNRADIFNYTFNDEFISKKFGTITKIKFLIELKFNNKIILQKNILGICEKKEEILMIMNKDDKTLLNKKRVLLTINKKQIYWIRNKVFDDNGNKFNFNGNFHLFIIKSSKQMNKFNFFYYLYF